MSGLDEISRRLDALDNVAVCRLGNSDIVRHPLVAEMLDVL
jgi:phosphate starvation-inducible PhoH-like protein